MSWRYYLKLKLCFSFQKEVDKSKLFSVGYEQREREKGEKKRVEKQSGRCGEEGSIRPSTTSSSAAALRSTKYSPYMHQHLHLSLLITQICYFILIFETTFSAVKIKDLPLPFIQQLVKQLNLFFRPP